MTYFIDLGQMDPTESASLLRCQLREDQILYTLANFDSTLLRRGQLLGFAQDGAHKGTPESHVGALLFCHLKKHLYGDDVVVLEQL